MHHRSTVTRSPPDPEDPFLRAVARRLNALDGLTEPTAEEAAELGRLRVIWAHAQPTPAIPAPRRGRKPR
ncbi:hypothetical protein R5W24_001794 [Gemmata sp. JC717]|uniref:hypothetical protein n=1 Tax=Gemmata algarum TaxID=2975278 RepID=UPI0021BACDD2|nr:hypothetical protein [Gemmata algarum]MDY3552707.1 hypothetical protein [Gemmata algarum]